MLRATRPTGEDGLGGAMSLPQGKAIMKTNSHDCTAIGAILFGTAGALALSILFFARAQSPHVRVMEMETHPDAEAPVSGTEGRKGRTNPLLPSSPAAFIVIYAARPDDNFTPHDVTPRMTNATEVGRALQRAYPALLRDAGIGGSVRVWFFVDEEGVVQEAGLREKSGHAPLDAAALAVTEIVEFTPAMNEGKNVPMWISLPITFLVR